MSASLRSASVSSESGRTRESPVSASRPSVMYSAFAGIVSRTVLLSSAASAVQRFARSWIPLARFYRKLPNSRNSYLSLPEYAQLNHGG